MKALTPSATLAFHRKIREHVKRGKEILSLGLGEAEIPTPPHIVEAGMKALRDGMTRYSTPQGLPALRERVAHHLRTANGIAAEADRIIVTPGAKNALFLACAALLEPGDEVVLLRPCYVSNAPILGIACPGVRVREVDMTPRAFDLDREGLSRAVTDRTRLLFVNTPHNPTGRMLSSGDIDFLTALMVRHPALHLLSDEVYESIVVGNAGHISPASISEIAERVVTVGGFSKTFFMTGWRIGYAHASDAVARAMLMVHEHTNTNTAAFVQHAAIAALDGDRDCVRDYLRKLKDRKAIYERFVSGSAHLGGTAYEGGYFAFLDTSASRMDSDAFAVSLLAEKNVAVVPGLAFGRNCRDHCRISFVNETGIFEEGLGRILEFLESAAHA